MLTLLRESLRDLGAILTTGGRLIARHWPQLLALYLAGAAARMTFLWLALTASKSSSLLGVLILPLAPISMLLALIFMVRAAGQSLPAAPETATSITARERWLGYLTLAARALIPFLIVYAAQGFLKEDVRLFIHSSTLDETINDPLTANYGRAVVDTATLAVIVVAALVARKLIAAGGLAGRSLKWNAVSGYIETLWMMTLGTAFGSMIAAAREWALSRVVVANVLETRESLAGVGGPASDLATGILSGLGSLLGNMADLLVVPVSWLAIAAIVYGSKLAHSDLPTHEAMTARYRRIPGMMRRMIAQVTEPVTTPVKDGWKAVSQVAEAGIVPMVLLCIGLALLTKLVAIGTIGLARAVIGPRDMLVQLALQPYVSLVERGILFILITALAAAAANRVLLANRKSGQEAARLRTAETAA